ELKIQILKTFLHLCILTLSKHQYINKDIPYVVKMTILMFLTISVGLASASLCQYYASYTCQNVGNDIRKNLLNKISLFSYSD
ncbi:ABC transporter, ATP-binding/permease protein, partial [human gut metagenome]